MIRRLLFADAAPGQPFHAYLRRPDFAFPPHCHDFWEAFLCIAGRGIHEINGQNHALAPGDLWLLRPDDIHSVRPQSEFAFINVSWPLETWDKWRELAALDGAFADDDWLHGHTTAPQLESLFRGLIAPHSPSARALEICRLWAEIAAVLEHRTARETRPDWMLRALRALETEEGLPAGWPLLLQTSRVSPGHLCREWKKSFGATPTQWINARRLENAAGLLLQSNLPIKEISARCGFEKTTYFYRLFQQKYGIPPGIYRQKTR